MLNFRKSRRSTLSNCVEVAYRAPSQCSGPNNDCVEVGEVAGDWYVRDSKDPDGPVLRFTAAEWSAFIAGAKDGEFDVPA